MEDFVRESTSLNAAGAKRALQCAETEAARNGWRVAITVADAEGVPVATLRMDGAPMMCLALSAAKARTAAQLGKSSEVFQKLVDGGWTSLLAIPGFTPLAGGVPILLRDSVIGAVGVSGADPDQDIIAAEAGASAFSDIVHAAGSACTSRPGAT